MKLAARMFTIVIALSLICIAAGSLTGTEGGEFLSIVVAFPLLFLSTVALGVTQLVQSKK